MSKKYGAPNLANGVEIHAFPAWQEKIRTRKSYGYWEPLINPYENEGFRPPGKPLRNHLSHDITMRLLGAIRIPL